jgi:hypothetical protein
MYVQAYIHVMIVQVNYVIKENFQQSRMDENENENIKRSEFCSLAMLLNKHYDYIAGDR